MPLGAKVLIEGTEALTVSPSGTLPAGGYGLYLGEHRIKIHSLKSCVKVTLSHQIFTQSHLA